MSSHFGALDHVTQSRASTFNELASVDKHGVKFPWNNSPSKLTGQQVGQLLGAPGGGSPPPKKGPNPPDPSNGPQKHQNDDSGIPSWVWLVGGAAVLYYLTQ